MEIISARVSVYEVELDLSDWGQTHSNQVPGFAAALAAAVPTLAAHKCMSGRDGGFLEELHTGTNFAHVIEHVLLALLNLAFPSRDAFTGWTRQTGARTYMIHYNAPDFLTGHLVVVMSVDAVKRLIRGDDVPVTRYLNLLRQPRHCFTDDDQFIVHTSDLVTQVANVHQARHLAASLAGDLCAIDLPEDQAQHLIQIFLQVRHRLPQVAGRWRSAFLEYAGTFGRTILDKMALANPDQFLDLLVAGDFAAFWRASHRAGLLLGAYRIPPHFVTHSLWLYKNTLLRELIDAHASQPDKLCLVLRDCEVFFQLLLRVVSEALNFHLFGADTQEIRELSEFREIGKDVGRILIVDDDEMIRRVCCDLLEYRGYLTAAARDGTEALQILAESEEPIQVVILDVRLSGMDSRDIYRHIRTMRPDVRILILTGYPITADLKAAFPEDEVAWLQKPFQSEELLAKILSLGGAGCGPHGDG